MKPMVATTSLLPHKHKVTGSVPRDDNNISLDGWLFVPFLHKEFPQNFPGKILVAIPDIGPYSVLSI